MFVDGEQPTANSQQEKSDGKGERNSEVEAENWDRHH